ncbi:MAG TPA: hypothetical protein VHK27_13870 [Gammaproteobacteria bacterium]|nr:hypothetical protein [Gammaproteobacteria bacterium]
MTRAEEMIVSHGRTLEGFDHEGLAGTRRGLRRAPVRRCAKSNQIGCYPWRLAALCRARD